MLGCTAGLRRIVAFRRRTPGTLPFHKTPSQCCVKSQPRRRIDTYRAHNGPSHAPRPRGNPQHYSNRTRRYTARPPRSTACRPHMPQRSRRQVPNRRATHRRTPPAQPERWTGWRLAPVNPHNLRPNRYRDLRRTHRYNQQRAPGSHDAVAHSSSYLLPGLRPRTFHPPPRLQSLKKTDSHPLAKASPRPALGNWASPKYFCTAPHA